MHLTSLLDTRIDPHIIFINGAGPPCTGGGRRKPMMSMRLLTISPCTSACSSHASLHIGRYRGHWQSLPGARRIQPERTASPNHNTVATCAAAGNYQLEPPITREQLNDPAHIGAAATVERPTRDRGGEASLDAYLNLPVSQYDRLDPDLIKPLGFGKYALKVPRVQLFSVWVEPLVHVTVVSNKDSAGRSSVTIRAVNWGLSGSPLIESVGLARRFNLEFCTLLSWAPATNESTNGANLNGTLKGTTTLDVYTEVIGPFRYMPRQVLETGGNAVMQSLNNVLLPLFMRRLSDDYERWASDPNYRLERQKQHSTSLR